MVDLDNISHIEIINHYFPDISVYANGPTYNDIVWLDNNPVNNLTLDEKRLEYSKKLLLDDVMERAEFLRSDAMYRVLGTTDPIQIRVYDDKYKAAKEYKANVDANGMQLLGADMPIIIQAETEITGENPYALSIGIINDYEFSHNALANFYGQLEGIRRNFKKKVMQSLDMSQLMQVSDATFPSADSLQPYS